MLDTSPFFLIPCTLVCIKEMGTHLKKDICRPCLPVFSCVYTPGQAGRLGSAGMGGSAGKLNFH